MTCDNSNTVKLAEAAPNSNRIDFAEVLLRLGYEYDIDGFISIGYKPEGHGFRTTVCNPVAALWFVFGDLLGPYAEFRCDVWFSINSLRGGIPDGKRGMEADVVWWRALYADLDIKPGSFKDIGEVLAFIATLSVMIGTRPTLIIFSGHGAQPVWVIEDGELDTPEKYDRAYRLSRRFGRLAETVGWRDFKASIDNVSDLSRLLRVPGTRNFKNPQHSVEAYAVADSGAPLTVDRIEEILDEWVPELEPDTPRRQVRRAVSRRPLPPAPALPPALAALLSRKYRRGLVRFVREASSGNRNNRLLWAGCEAIRDGLMSEENDRGWDELADAAADSGLDDYEITTTLRSALRTEGGGN